MKNGFVLGVRCNLGTIHTHTHTNTILYEKFYTQQPIRLWMKKKKKEAKRYPMKADIIHALVQLIIIIIIVAEAGLKLKETITKTEEIKNTSISDCSAANNNK